jgi:hypothetical protein
MEYMPKRTAANYRTLVFAAYTLLCLSAPITLLGQLTPAAVASFNEYDKAVETRLAQQHTSAAHFIVAPSSTGSVEADARLRAGELIIERLSPTDSDLPGAMLHHWRGTAFVAGAKSAAFERIIRDFHAYPHYFSPQVLDAKVIAQRGDMMQTSMRVRQKHVITVVMDATYDVQFGRLDAEHGYSTSKSTHISEIA